MGLSFKVNVFDVAMLHNVPSFSKPIAHRSLKHKMMGGGGSQEYGLKHLGHNVFLHDGLVSYGGEPKACFDPNDDSIDVQLQTRLESYVYAFELW